MSIVSVANVRTLSPTAPMSCQQQAMPDEATTFGNQDLVLQVRPDFDPQLLDLDRYEAFLDALCGDREYQKEAIQTVARYLAGGQYTDTGQLAAENYAKNDLLAERYGSLEGLTESLPFPNKLA